MAGKMEVRIEGLNALLRQFEYVDKSVRKKYLGAALRAAMKPSINSLKAATPKGPTGNLRRSVGIKIEKTRRGNAFGLIGPRQGGKFKGYHAYWSEDGVGIRKPVGKALKIPQNKAKALASVAVANGAIFIAKARAYAGSKFFSKWVSSNLPTIARRLKDELGPAAMKAFDEQARRSARRGK